MAKKIKVLDNVSGVEQIINVSSLASNSTITGTDLMLIEQSNTLKKVSITDLSAEFGGGLPSGTENQTLTYNSSNNLVATSILETSISNNQIYANQLLNANNGINIAYSTGNMLTLRSTSNQINLKAHANTTQNLTINIKNTKATLEDGDILVFDDTDSTFKVDNISNYVGGGGGNTYTISLPFSKGGGNVNGSVTVPTNAILLNCWIKIEEELSTTGAPFLIRLDGSSPLLIAEQGNDFSEMVGVDAPYRFNGSQGTSLPEGMYKVTSTDSGVLQANHSGSGFGSGIIYLQYSTELS